MSEPLKPGDRVKLVGHSAAGTLVDGKKAFVIGIQGELVGVRLDMHGIETMVTPSQCRRRKPHPREEWEGRWMLGREAKHFDRVFVPKTCSGTETIPMTLRRVRKPKGGV